MLDEGLPPALVVGLMSGTSMDAVDAALVHVEPARAGKQVKLVAFTETKIDAEMRERLRLVASGEPVPAAEICQLDIEVGELFAEAAMSAIREAQMEAEEVDLVASHGQTVCHISEKDEAKRWNKPATMQLGEAAVIAERTGITTVADFHVRDIAAGGKGGPIMPFAERILFGDGSDSDLLFLTIGGISNLTLLSRSGSVLAIDTGPGNMAMDLIVQHAQQKGFMKGEPFDEGGKIAGSGKVCEAVVEQFRNTPLMRQAPPRAFGREQFGEEFVEWIEMSMKQSDGRDVVRMADKLATACELTAVTIADAIQTFVLEAGYRPSAVILSGGGVANACLVSRLQEHCPGLAWVPSDAYGVPHKAKDAMGFALLGYAALHRIPGNLPQATGASRPVVLGKIVPGHGACA